YWMMDWTVALLADADHADDPLIGMKMIGESPTVWQPIIDFQDKHIKQNQLLQYMSFSNLQDELNLFGDAFFVHNRTLLRSYYRNPSAPGLHEEIRRLEMAMAEMPSTEGIKNRELQILMNVTFLR